YGGRAAIVAMAALAALLTATPLYAHDFWIEPETFRPASGAAVGVHLKVGQNLDGDLVPRANRQIDRFVAVSETGETPIVGPDAGEPAGRFKAGAPGPVVIAYRSLPTPVELEAAKFEAYLVEEGLEAVVKARAARGDTGKPGKEIFARCAKSLLDVAPAAAAAPMDPSGAPKPGLGHKPKSPSLYER